MAGNYDPNNLPADYYDYPALEVSGVVGGLTQDGTGAKIVIMSHIATDVSLYLDNVLISIISMTATTADAIEVDGNGDSHAGYYGNYTFTGLSEFTEYSWSIVQGSGTDSGKFRTNTNKKATKFSLALSTCFAPNTSRPGDISAWNFLKHHIDTTEFPYLATLHSDDIYYVQGFQSTQQGQVNTQGKLVGLTNNNSGLRTEYDFALHYMGWFGLLTPFYSTGLVDIEGQTLVTTYDAALSPSFRYCVKNGAFMPQWGDHEFANNIGWATGPLLSAVPNGYHKTLNGYDGNGLTVYNQLIAPLQGDSAQSADTNANHWSINFGGLLYLSFDPITNAVYNANPALSVTYGTNQITDMLTIAASNTQWFTCVANAGVAGRGTPTYETANFPQYNYKSENFSQPEYDRLWLDTGLTPPALMDNVYTNGIMGSCFMVRGDWHYPVNFHWNAPANGGSNLAAEDFMEIGLGTVNSSAGGSKFLGADLADFTTDNVALLPSNTSVFNGSTYDDKPDQFLMTILEYDGTLPTPEVIIKQWNIRYNASTDTDQLEWFTDQDSEEQTDEDGNIWKIVLAKRLIIHSGNQGYDIDETDIFQYAGVSTGGDS